MTKGQAMIQAYMDFYDFNIEETATRLDIGTRQHLSQVMRKKTLTPKMDKSLAAKVRESMRRDGFEVDELANLLVQYHEGLDVLQEDDGDVSLD